MRATVMLNGAAIVDTLITPAANVLQSAFKSIECTVAGMRITRPHNFYGYQAYIEDTFLERDGYKKSALTNQAYFPDTEAMFTAYSKDDDIAANKGAFARNHLIAASIWAQLSGRLRVFCFFELKF